MDYYIILRPLIGAGIGYVTNWIAVKMMFRPLKPVKIGKLTLPFTPGIIPKNKERIAKAIGNTISNNLLTENTLTESLLSEEKQKLIRESIERKIYEISNEEEITIKEKIQDYIDEDLYSKTTKFIKNKLTNIIIDTLKEEDIGNLVAKQIEAAAKEKMQGSILGIFGANNLISKITDETAKKINEYIDENGKELISVIIMEKISEFEEEYTSDIAKKIKNSEIDFISIIMNIYNKIIEENISKVLNAIDISKVVEDKINSMNMLELEKLILEIMNKELKALVNLGAIIGFVLGLLNLTF